MKASLLPEPERWSDRDTGQTAGSAEDVIGASFRQIRATTEPSEAAAGRWVRHALATRRAPSAGASGPWRSRASS